MNAFGFSDNKQELKVQEETIDISGETLKIPGETYDKNNFSRAFFSFEAIL